MPKIGALTSRTVFFPNFNFSIHISHVSVNNVLFCLLSDHHFCDPVILMLWKKLSPQAIRDELIDQAPVFQKLLETATVAHQSRPNTSDDDPVRVSTCAAQILKTRCYQMSAWANKLGITAHHEGISERVSLIL